MSNVIELLLRVKPNWESAYLQFLEESEESHRLTSRDVARLFEIFLESHLTGDSRRLMHLIDEWLEISNDELDEPISFEIYQERSLIRDLHALHTLLQNNQELTLTDEERRSIQEALDQFFFQAVEYVAYTEAMQNLVRTQRRQNEIQADLERLDESRANFVSIAAHGLKTPLTLVEGYSQMLMEQLSSRDEDATPLLAGIESGTLRMRELIDDLVDVALIDNKMLSLYFQPLRLVEVIEEVLEQFNPLIESKGIGVKFETSDDFKKTVYADRERFSQALLEVVDNAVKYSPADGTILIRGRGLPGFLEISVRDQGVGIAPENHARVFNQFASSSDGLRSKDDSYHSLGSGLGLHLCKGIVEAHGGAVWVDSPGYDVEKSPGSTFHLMIPALEEPPDDPSSRLLDKTRG